MANKPEDLLNDVMKAQEQKNPALAEKQARLLAILQANKVESAGKALLTREALLAQKPKPENFDADEQFEEALGRWMENQGKILALTKSPKGSQPK